MGVQVTILILVDGFLQSYSIAGVKERIQIVTILILVDGFLQSVGSEYASDV